MTHLETEKAVPMTGLEEEGKHPPADAKAGSSRRRFDSVDALRGLAVSAMLLVNNPGNWGAVYAPLLHAAWNGCTPTDLVFPFFLFIVGVSIALGITPRVEAGADPVPIRRALWIRAAKIIGIGLAINLLIWWLYGQPHFRLWGVLQRVGLCFLVVGELAMRSGVRFQVVLIVTLLLGYCSLLGLNGGFEPFTNLASRMDAALFAPLIYDFDPATGRGHDPEGLLSTLPAIATTLIGHLAGGWLRDDEAILLLPGALGCLLVGWLWTAVEPWNKNLWTSSFVLWTAGWAMALLWLFHRLVDMRGWPKLGRAPGINAITVYAGSVFLIVVLAPSGARRKFYDFAFADWMTPIFGPYVPSLAYGLVFTGIWWGVAKLMEQRGIVLKV